MTKNEGAGMKPVKAWAVTESWAPDELPINMHGEPVLHHTRKSAWTRWYNQGRRRASRIIRVEIRELRRNRGKH